MRLQNPKRIIIAVPIASRETCDELRRDADEIVCAFTPAPLVAVGVWYQDFSQTPDEEVRRLLKMAEQSVAGP
ncbi:MAG: hypothetical protein JO270_14835 [Acidobacteriaceae bacterium]|nr:hypothetical protein [Acidobacteriaceae bacterium]